MIPKRFNIVFAGNNKILKGMYLAMLSTMINSPGHDYTFYVLTMKTIDSKQFECNPITENGRLILEKMVKSFNPNNEVKLIDCSPIYKQELEGNKNHLTRYSPYTMLRLFFFKLVHEDFDNLLYLDCDILIHNDLATFYKTYDMTNYELAAVPDYLGRYYIGEHYFNAGVLFLNAKKIQETKLFDRALDVLKEKTLYFPDQSALNMLVKDWLELPKIYNSQRKCRKDTVIQHFPGRIARFWAPIKPWHINEVRKNLHIKAYDDVYKYYLDHYPFDERKEEKPIINFDK